jgi:murein DD-endopeptidase MepM/ murein hydrolase activator NlpD
MIAGLLKSVATSLTKKAVKSKIKESFLKSKKSDRKLDKKKLLPESKSGEIDTVQKSEPSSIIVRPSSALASSLSYDVEKVKVSVLKKGGDLIFERLSDELEKLVKTTASLNEAIEQEYRNDVKQNISESQKKQLALQTAKEEREESKKNVENEKKNFGLGLPKVPLLDQAFKMVQGLVLGTAIMQVLNWFSDPKKKDSFFKFLADNSVALILGAVGSIAAIGLMPLIGPGSLLFGTLGLMWKIGSGLVSIALKIGKESAKLGAKGLKSLGESLKGKPTAGKPTVGKPTAGRGLLKGARRLGKGARRLAGKTVTAAGAVIEYGERVGEGQTQQQAIAGTAAETAGFWAGAKVSGIAASKILSPLLAAPFPGARPLYGVLVLGSSLSGGFAAANVSGNAIDKLTGAKVSKHIESEPKQTLLPEAKPDISVGERAGYSKSRGSEVKPDISVGERAGYSKSRGRVHRGRDIAAPQGTGLTVPSESVITDKGSEASYGNYVVFKDADGIEHFYGHMVEKSPFNIGDTITPGTVIGRVGSTGRSTGPHLHWEISSNPGEVGFARRNVIDPIEYGYAADIPFVGKTSELEMIKKSKDDSNGVSSSATYEESGFQSPVFYVPQVNTPSINGPAQQSSATPPVTTSPQEMLNTYYKSQILSSLYRH